MKNGTGAASEPSGLPKAKSRKAKLAAKASEKKITVSSAELTIDEKSGGRHQAWRRSRSKIVMSRSWATRNAVPEAIAMRGVASQIDRITAITKPATTTLRAPITPNRLLARSV